MRSEGREARSQPVLTRQGGILTTEITKTTESVFSNSVPSVPSVCSVFQAPLVLEGRQATRYRSTVRADSNSSA